MKINKGPGLFAATVGISAAVTAGFGLLEVLAGWIVAALLRLLPARKSREISEVGVGLTMVGAAALMSGAITAAERAFPADGTFPFVSVALLLLLYCTMTGIRESGKLVCNVVGLMMALLMGALLLVGLRDISWKEALRADFSGFNILIIICITAPWWWQRDNEEEWKWFLGAGSVSLGLSLLTSGNLGANLTKYSSFPLYDAVQTVRIFGTLQRFEAILAAGVLLGAYAMLVELGDVVQGTAEKVKIRVENRVWIIGILVVSFLLEIGFSMLSDRWQGYLSTAFWGFAALFALWVVILRKIGKNEKSA